MTLLPPLSFPPVLYLSLSPLPFSPPPSRSRPPSLSHTHIVLELLDKSKVAERGCSPRSLYSFVPDPHSYEASNSFYPCDIVQVGVGFGRIEQAVKIQKYTFPQTFDSWYGSLFHYIVGPTSIRLKIN